MKNIVATIQKEQNLIVRDQKSKILLVQGAAGSGKTSVALHRIAYLLYQNRKNISSNEILIISPNDIFVDYISNILPELGEQNILEVSFDEFAKRELKGICQHETKYEQLEYIIKCSEDNDNRLKRIHFKNKLFFVNELKKHVARLENSLMCFRTFKFGNLCIDKTELEKWYYEIYKNRPIFKRIELMAERVANIYENDFNAKVSIQQRKDIKRAFMSMAYSSNMVLLYKEFIVAMKEKHAELEHDLIDTSFLLYEDVFPLILCKYLLCGGGENFSVVKHVVIDEMQDYTVAQFELVKLIFKNNMTILGDVNQVIDPNNVNDIEDIKNIFQKDATLVRMLKSYRSTFEIGQFCRMLGKIEGGESFERHGKTPVFYRCDDFTNMIKRIEEKIDIIDFSTVTTVAILCKSNSAANKLYDALSDEHRNKCCLLDSPNDKLKEGVVVSSSYLVKGLEFDIVILPDVSDTEYNTEIDRKLLYIACTRALHELEGYHYGMLCKFLDDIVD